MSIDNNMTANENTLSDYDKEWGLDEVHTPSPEASSSHTDELQTTAEEGSAPNSPAQAESQSTSQDANSKAAEPEGEDIFATMNDKQLEAYKKAERERDAMIGRHRVANDKLSHLERQLADERKLNAELAEKARQPSQFEQDHPDYYKQLKDELTPAAPESGDTSQTAADIILEAVPKAGEIYNSDEFQAWLGSQEQSYLSDIESPDPQKVINILDKYEAHNTSAAEHEAAQNKLNQIANTGGSSGIPDIRHSGNMSASEQYDAVWAEDD